MPIRLARCESPDPFNQRLHARRLGVAVPDKMGGSICSLTGTNLTPGILVKLNVRKAGQRQVEGNQWDERPHP
jgi:hypothetical protein